MTSNHKHFHRPFGDYSPKISESAITFEQSTILGDVTIGEKSSVWFGAVLRGDVNFIRIGRNTNIQDNSTVHVTKGGSPTVIGDNVTVGHNAVVHACTVEDNVLVGMGAIILDDAKISKNSLVAAGAVVTGGKTFPPGSLILGSPAKVARKLTETEIEKIQESADKYFELAGNYFSS